MMPTAHPAVWRSGWMASGTLFAPFSSPPKLAMWHVGNSATQGLCVPLMMGGMGGWEVLGVRVYTLTHTHTDTHHTRTCVHTHTHTAVPFFPPGLVALMVTVFSMCHLARAGRASWWTVTTSLWRGSTADGT